MITGGSLRWPVRVAATIGAVPVASVVSVLVRPLTHAVASPLFVAAVTASAWLGGPACGLLATALATLALDVIMVSRRSVFVLSEPAAARLAVFVFVALFVSALDHARRRAENQRAVLLERERAARAEAEDANRAKDEFVTMVAHELRTPLTAILGWSAAISDARLGPAVSTRALEAGDHRVAAACPPVPGDAARLQQAVSNLLRNAIEHSDAGTSVDVEVDTVGADARIVVRDEGHGIAPALLPHVFEPYRQGEGGARAGLGLGLAIVRQLVELHGGRVEARSAGLGHGACFTVLLPALRQAGRISPTTRTRTRSELPGR